LIAMGAPLKEKFPVGTHIRINGKVYLEKFKTEWKYHHPLSVDQIQAADRIDRIRKVGFYHGGDVLCDLEHTPGTWNEECLEPII